MDETNTQNAHRVESVQIRSYLLSTISWALFYGFICMMEKVNSGYSIKNIPNLQKEHPDTFRKNIPIPSEITYLLQLMKKVKMVIARMRWIAIHFNNNDSTDNWNQRWYKLYFLIRPQFCSGLVSIFNRCFYMLFCLLPMFYRIFYIFPLSFHIILWNLSV